MKKNKKITKSIQDPQNPYFMAKTEILNEQVGYDPFNDDTFNPCSMAQFDLNCVYAGRKGLNGRFYYPGGSTNSEWPPVTSASVACGANAYNPTSSPPQVCLFYDQSISKYVIYDTNPLGTNDCDAPNGCSWGTTINFNNGTTEDIQFYGYECDNLMCVEYNTGNASYDTLASCGLVGVQRESQR